MSNRTPIEPTKQSPIKASTGVNAPSATDLRTNSFLPTNVISPDSSTPPQVTQRVDSFGPQNFSPIPQQSSQQNAVDLILQQSFTSSRASSTANQQILNRDIVATGLNLATNSNNVQVNGTNFLSFSGLNGNFKQQITNTFQDNILDDYDNITYNFRLLIAPENYITENTLVPTTNLYVIAQTGVSSTFYIRNVEIESIVGPNARTKNTQATLFRVEIVEPQGISLIDKILEAASAMGIRNIMNAPMILELTFRGYNQNGAPAEVNIAKRSWKIQLIDMPTYLDTGGSEYKLNFVSICDYGFHRFASASVIKQQMSFAVENIGEFFDNLGYQLTLQDALISTKGEQSRNEYRFEVLPEMRNWVIGQADTQPNAPSMFIDENGKRGVILKPGHKIEDIVDNIFSTTREANDLANPKSDPNKMDQPQQGTSISKIINVSSNSEIISFNEQNSEYVRRFTYYINLYDAFRALPDKPDQSNQQERAAYLLQDALKKQYQYMFTGQNTSVLSLSLELNNLWRHATTYYTYGIHRSGNIESNFLVQNPVDNNNPDDLRNQITTRFQQGTLTPRTDSLITPDLDQELNPSFILDNITVNGGSNQQDQRLQLQQRLQTLQGAGSTNTVALQEAIASLDTLNSTIPLEGLGTVSIIPGINSARSFIPKLISELPARVTGTIIPANEPLLIETIPTQQRKNPLVNSMFIKQVDPALDVNRVNDNVENTTEFSRTIFGVIANQMYSGVYSDLLEIELEIRGDPYWLGETDAEKIRRLQDGASRQVSQGEFANYLRGENSFFLTFNTPKNYNESTGFVEVSESTTFIGIYNVIRITHSFADGRFIQKLLAVRDINTDPQIIKRLVT